MPEFTVGPPPAQPPATPGPGDPAFTGRWLIAARPRSARLAAAVEAVQATGLRARDGLGIEADQPNDDDAIVCEHLGVAIVPAGAAEAVDRVRHEVAAVDAGSDDDGVLVVEPERYVYASADPFVEGFLAGAHALAESLGHAPVVPTPRARTADFTDTAAFTWGLQALGADGDDAAAARDRGRGVRVAVLDTGCAEHPDLPVVRRRSFVDDRSDPLDRHGHGTHCCGTVAGSATPSAGPAYGVAPGAELLAGKVLDDSGRGTDGSILEGINWAIAEEADLISMSLGAPTDEDAEPIRTFEVAASAALERGILIVAASGNDSDRPGRVAPVGHPANCRGIVAVAALDHGLRAARFSNGGLVGVGRVLIAAPGVDVVSATLGGRTARLSGTSMATPHVAGAGAAVAAETGFRGARLLAELLNRTRAVAASSADVGTGCAHL